MPSANSYRLPFIRRRLVLTTAEDAGGPQRACIPRKRTRYAEPRRRSTKARQSARRKRRCRWGDSGIYRKHLSESTMRECIQPAEVFAFLRKGDVDKAVADLHQSEFSLIRR